MANPLWAALGGFGGGLTQLAQTLANRRQIDEERRRQFEVQNQQMALQREQFEHLKSQNALQNTRQNTIDQRTFAQQDLENLIRNLNFAQPGQRLDPSIATAAHQKQIPLIQSIDPTPLTSAPIAPGMPEAPGMGLPTMGYSRAPTMAEQSSQQQIEASKQQMKHATTAEGRAATTFGDMQTILAEIAGLKPGQIPSPKALAVLNKSAEDFWTPEQKISHEAKIAGARAAAQANATANRPMSEKEKTAFIASTRRQVQALTKDLYIVRERMMGIDDAMANITNAAAKRRGWGPEVQTILVNFQKGLDALSVVREAEYLRSEQIRPLKERMIGLVEKWRTTGTGLTAEELSQYADMARQLLHNSMQIAQERIEPFRLQVEEKGLPWEQIINPKSFEDPKDGSGGNQYDFVEVGGQNMSVLPKNYTPGGKR